MEEKSEIKFPINYEEKINSQKEIVEKAAVSLEKNPSDQNDLEFNRELDLLRHYENAAGENPKERAAAVARSARKIALNKAVQQLPVE